MKLIDIQHQFFTYGGQQYYCTKAETDSLLNVIAVYCKTADGSEVVIRGKDKIAKIIPGTLGAPYFSVSDELPSIVTSVPDSMADDITSAMLKLKNAVGGSTVDFVCERLQWTRKQIEEYLLAEQVDSVALAIYNIEARHQAIIIGDQTGIGKGRMAASLIRYAYVKGKKAVFITEQPKLFADIYRDLSDTGSADLVPFIIADSTDKDAKINLTDENGEIIKTIYSPLPDNKKYKVINGKLDYDYNYVLTTYSQFRAQTDPEKQTSKDRKGLERYKFLIDTAENGVLILDEVHNAAGSSMSTRTFYGKEKTELKGSNTFVMISKAVQVASAVCFLSATFAKRPENMPLYAFRSCLSETQLSDIELISSISKGGEALQEIISSSLVKEGQMVRREKTYDGIDVNYIYLDKEGNKKHQVPDLEQLHRSLSDNITGLMLKIVDFEKKYVSEAMSIIAETSAAYGEEVSQNNQDLGVKHTEYFSRVFNIVGQMLLSVKAEAVADHAIRRLKEGKKVVIAISHTSEAMLQDIMDESGIEADSGNYIRTDFSQGLLRGLKNTLKYSVKGEDGKSQGSYFIPLEMLSEDGQKEFNRLSAEIMSTKTGVNCSPIDVIEQKLQKAGYSFGEITGRKYRVEFTDDTFTNGRIFTRKPESKNTAVIKYQNNKTDVLIINTSGATGLSVHATNKGTSLPENEVKPRCMIIAECELDISKEVQKRGRINRTGQLKNIPPSYDYLMSAIPAEKRNMMMLQKKLLSLDANTTSKQKQSTGIIDVPDFLNKYGDMAVTQYLKDNAEINDRMNDPLNLFDEDKGKMKETEKVEGAAKKVSGRVAMLKCADQEDFYNSVYESYNSLVENLKLRGEYDLEVNEIPLNATLIGSKSIFTAQKSKGNSVFAEASYIGNYECDVLVKPFSRTEVEGMLQNFKTEHGGQDPQDTAAQLADELEHNALTIKKGKEIEETANYSVKYTTINQNKDLKPEKKAEKLAELEKKHKSTLIKIEADCNKKISRKHIIKHFYAGRECFVFDNMRAVCLGAKIGKAKNRYTLSNITICFAVASTVKYVEFNLSDNGFAELGAISAYGDPQNSVLENWQQIIQDATKSREMRRIVTGNILAAYPQVEDLMENEDCKAFNVKLVNFTLSNGGREKGILLPKTATDGIVTKSFSKVKISDAKKYLKNETHKLDYPSFTKTIDLSTGCKMFVTTSYGNIQEINFSTPNVSKNYKEFMLTDFWLNISDNGRGCDKGRNYYSITITSGNLDDKFLKILEYLEKSGLQLEVESSEVSKIIGSRTLDDNANWKPLTVNRANIPGGKISRLLSNAIKLAALKNGGSPLSGVYNRMANKFWRLEDRFFPTDEKLKKIYDNICKSGKLSVTLLQQLKLYSNDTRRNINQISGIIGKNDRTYVGALLLRGSSCGHRTSSFGILSTGREAFRRRELQQQLLRQFAELEGIWYKSKEDFITKNRLVIAKDEYGRDIAGTETKVYHDPLCNLVYKFLRINANSNYLYDNLLERIIVHNLMFGDKTALYIEGLFFDDNFISIAVSQPFIRYAHRLTKKEQQDKFFAQFTNFTRTNKTCIVNDDLVVYDLHNNNVLVDDNGEYYVIDCYAKFYRKDDLTNHYNYENVNSTLSGPYVSETTDCEGHSIKIGDIVAFPKAEYGGKTFLFGVVKSIKLVMDKEHSDVGVFLIKRNKKMLCFDKEYYRENNLIQYVTNTGQYDEASLIKSFERCVNDYFASTYEKDKSLLIKTIHDDINTAEYRLREYKADMKRYDNYAKHLSWQEAQSYFHAKLYADTYQEWINNVYSSPLLSNAIKLAALKNE